MVIFDSTMAIRFSAALPHSRPPWSSEDFAGVLHVASCRLPVAGNFDFPWCKNRLLRTNGGSLRKLNLIKTRVRASSTKRLGPGSSDPKKKNGNSQYHPSEDIAKLSPLIGDAILTSEETARTIIEVNSKATLMFSNLLNDELRENIIWPELPYVTDEHGNIYFQVKDAEDTMQTLTSENCYVQVFIGMDTMEMISDLESSGAAEMDFGIEEIESDGNDTEGNDDNDDDDEDDDDDDDDDYDGDWVTILEDNDGEDDEDEEIGDWAKLETMSSSHPMDFAKKISEVVSDTPVDWMEQPPASLAIQGVVRPAFIEEHSVIQKHLSNQQNVEADSDQKERETETVGDDEESKESIAKINGHGHKLESSDDRSSSVDGSENGEISSSGTTFYKLEMIKIHLYSSHGHETSVEVEELRKAQPDAIAHSAEKIISRLKACGDKTTQALKYLCWRVKGIQVEEAVIIGVDSLGFDMRICSGTQVQTLRFSFETRATSEYSAERQLNDLLFPRTQHKPQKVKQTNQTDC